MKGTATLQHLSLNVSGIYIVKDDRLDVRIKSAMPSGPGNPFSVIAAQQLAGLDRSGHIEWKNDHEFLLTSYNNVTLTFERIKQP